ncbi:MAG: ABC transporter ATP-binding protein [Candidatus Bathyarchaeia archaeon]
MVEVIKTVDLKKYFPYEKSIFKVKSYIKAVDGVTVSLNPGEIVGLVGESGSGKTTLGKVLAKLEDPTDGKVFFCGEDVTKIKGEQLKVFRRKVQMIFQNPYTSFDPRYNLYSSLLEPLTTHDIGETPEEKIGIMSKILEEVGLFPAEEFLYRYPHEMSGGQLQRASIARAMILNPQLLIADEPTSMLDASIRVGILNLIMKIKNEHQSTVLFITHDIATAKHICERIVVMYLGKVVEIAETEEIIENPMHPYVIALTGSVLTANPKAPEVEIKISGEPHLSINPVGCRLGPRCPYVEEICKTEEPQLLEVKKGHFVACHKISNSPKIER